MEDILRILKALECIQYGDTFSFATMSAMPIRSATTVATKKYYRESRQTMIEGLVKLANSIEQYNNQYTEETAELARYIGIVIPHLAILAENYRSDETVYRDINSVIVRLALSKDSMTWVEEVLPAITLTYIPVGKDNNVRVLEESIVDTRCTRRGCTWM